MIQEEYRQTSHVSSQKLNYLKIKEKIQNKYIKKFNHRHPKNMYMYLKYSLKSLSHPLHFLTKVIQYISNENKLARIKMNDSIVSQQL